LFRRLTVWRRGRVAFRPIGQIAACRLTRRELSFDIGQIFELAGGGFQLLAQRLLLLAKRIKLALRQRRAGGLAAAERGLLG